MTETSFIYGVFADYGLIGLWAVVTFTAFQFVVSIPMGPVIALLGGLASQGIVNIWMLWFAVYAGQVTGDNLGFFVGRKFGRPVLVKYGTKIIKPSALERAERVFTQYGAVAVFFTRFFFATVAAPLNVLAGASDLRWRRYLLAEMAGQAIWTSLYVFLGYFFGQQLQGVLVRIDQANVVAISLVTLVALVIFAWLAGRALYHHMRVVRRQRQG